MRVGVFEVGFGVLGLWVGEFLIAVWGVSGGGCVA